MCQHSRENTDVISLHLILDLSNLWNIKKTQDLLVLPVPNPQPKNYYHRRLSCGFHNQIIVRHAVLFILVQRFRNTRSFTFAKEVCFSDVCLSVCLFVW